MDSVIRLTEAERTYMLTLADHLTADPQADPDKFCEQAESLVCWLPLRLHMALDYFARSESSSGFLLIQTGLDLFAELPPTPPNNQSHIGETTRLARIQAICMSALADMVAYEAEGAGCLFQDIVPNPAMANLQTSNGSAELEIHTEQAFSPLRPDYLSLTCLRGDAAALTYTMPVGDILSEISEAERSLLRTPLWTCDVDLSFKLGEFSPQHWATRGPMPILYGSLHPQLVFDQDLMTGITDEAETLRKHVIEIYYKKRHGHVFCPGDIMIIDNNCAVHGRSGFSPRYDGLDRFLVRCFGIRHIRHVQSAMGPLRKILARYS